MNATLTDQLEAEIARAERGEIPEDDERRLTPEEETVFAIKQGRWPRLIETWQCFCAFRGGEGSTKWDETLLEHERALRPELLKRSMGMLAFVIFARELAGVKPLEACAMYVRNRVWLMRHYKMFWLTFEQEEGYDRE